MHEKHPLENAMREVESLMNFMLRQLKSMSCDIRAIVEQLQPLSQKRFLERTEELHRQQNVPMPGENPESSVDNPPADRS